METVKETLSNGHVVTKTVVDGQAVERTYSPEEWEKKQQGQGAPATTKPVLAEGEPPAETKPKRKAK